LCDYYLFDGGFGEAVAWDFGVPVFVEGDALEEVEEGEGGVGEDYEGDEGEEEVAVAGEFGDAQEEEADGDFGDGEGDKYLDPVEVVVFEEAFEVVRGEVLDVAAEAVGDFQHHEAHAHCVDDLLLRQSGFCDLG